MLEWTILNINFTIMHLSKYCPTYPPTGKSWGFDLILTAKHAPDQVDLININFTNNGAKCTVLRGHLILAFAPGGEGIDFIQVKSPPLARGVVPGAIH